MNNEHLHYFRSKSQAESVSKILPRIFAGYSFAVIPDAQKKNIWVVVVVILGHLSEDTSSLFAQAKKQEGLLQRSFLLSSASKN